PEWGVLQNLPRLARCGLRVLGRQPQCHRARWTYLREAACGERCQRRYQGLKARLNMHYEWANMFRELPYRTVVRGFGNGGFAAAKGGRAGRGHDGPGRDEGGCSQKTWSSF